MRRDQLEHAIRAACDLLGVDEVIVVGSQAVLASYHEAELPRQATMSAEVDVLPIGDDEDEVAALADRLEGVSGELSAFEELHGFAIDGVGLDTTVFPDGWRARLVNVQNPNTARAGADRPCIGWCLDKEDLCVAKLCAHREKDRNFVQALLDWGLVDHRVIRQRLGSVPSEARPAAGAALAWLTSWAAR